jgi:capsular exopolysaccharide synthesis family protein
LLLYEASKPVFRSPQQAEVLLGTSVRGNLHHMNGNGSNGRSYEKALVTNLPYNSSQLERYHMLRANLIYKADKNADGVYMLTSSEESSNPGLVATNLAIANARTGTRVLLIDADLRHPRVHSLLGLKNDAGLVDMLSMPADKVADKSSQENMLKKVIQPTSIDCLSVITTGESVTNPTQLIESGTMGKWLRNLSNSNQFDVVLLVTPSVLSYADTSALAATTGASILLVVKCEKTSTEDALKAKEQILHVGGSLEGVIVI